MTPVHSPFCWKRSKMRKWTPRCSREQEAFPTVGCRRGKWCHPLALAAGSLQQLPSQQKRLCFSSTHNFSAHMMHLLLCCFPEESRTGSFSLVHESFPFLNRSRNSRQSSCGSAKSMGWHRYTDRDAPLRNPQRIIHPTNYISNTILFPWGVTKWKIIVCLMCSLKL